MVPTPGFATETQCDLFEKAVRTSIGTDLPNTLEAGKTYNFVSTLKVIDELALKTIDPNSIIIWHLFRNGISGSRGSHSEPSYDLTDLQLKKNGETLSAQNSIDLAKNFKGKYQLGAFFTIQDTQKDTYCGGQILSETDSVFEVTNNSGSADILPPVFASTRILSKVVKPGSTFVVETKVTDENPLCGLAEVLTNICSGVWHVALESDEGNEINSFEPNSLLSEGTIVTLVKVPKDTKPGKYRLLMHDISDIFGNLFVDIPIDQAPSIEVISAN
jgi:hypothetical protein